jgi:putative membrane protein
VPACYGKYMIVNRLLTPLIWLLRLAVFFALFGLALKNGDSVQLRFYFDQVWQAPMSVVLLLSFSLGVILGLTVAIGHWFSRKATDRND